MHQLPLKPTDENIAKAKRFAARKYAERCRETNPLLARDHPSLIPTDLSGGFKFAALFAHRLFGGVIRGSQHHLWLVCHGKKIDLCADSGLTKAIGKKANYHHPNLLKLQTHRDSLRSCMPRVEQWVQEFLETLDGEELNEDFSFKPEEDPFGPKLMDKPKVLFRSVSLLELKDIFERGEIIGGQNRFNDFEHRKWVFFGDQITEQLIGQGEEIERQAVHMLNNHRVHHEFRHIKQNIEYWANFIRNRLNRLGIEFGEDEMLGLQHQGEHRQYFMRLAAQMEGDRSKYFQAIDEIQRLVEETYELGRVYRDALKNMANGIRLKNADKKASSAILVTKPIDGGLHYSKEFGKSGFQTDEYGFHPGQVKASDIDKVIFVKDGVRVASCQGWRALDVVKKLLGHQF